MLSQKPVVPKLIYDKNFTAKTHTQHSKQDNVWSLAIIDIERRKNRLLKFCYVPVTSAAYNRLLFLLRLFTVLMKQTRQVVCTVKQSILLDVYVANSLIYTYAP